MDRLTADGRLADLVDRAKREDSRRAGECEGAARAAELARRLLPQLAPLFASIAAQARTTEGAMGWVDAWGRQILAARLSDEELVRGLGSISQVIQSAGNPPLSFPLFLQACRPTAHLTGADLEARQPHPLLLTRDLGKSESWCAARDRALARLRARNFASD